MRHLKPFTVLTAAILAVAALSTTAIAGTLEDIAQRKRLIVGINFSSPPFGMLDKDNKPIGFDTELAELMAKELGTQIEFVDVTGPNRIPALLTKRVDIVIQAFGITAERARSVAFASPVGVLNQIVVGPKSIDLKSPADLSERRVGAVRGNIQDIEVTRVAPPDAKIMRLDDDATVASALVAGQLDAAAMNESTAVSIMEANPTKNFEQKFVLRAEPWSVGVRKDDEQFLHWVNTFIYIQKLRGTLPALFKKYFRREWTDPGVF